MNKYNIFKNNIKEKYYEYEGGYISYNPITREEKYTSIEMIRNK